MKVMSLGYRTDLMVRRLAGSEIIDRGDHIVVRTEHNRSFYWGNFILLADLPAAAEADRWLSTFAAEFPYAEHVSIGVDTTDSNAAAELAAFAEMAGMAAELSIVLTSTSVREPPRPNRSAAYRRLETDDDWQQVVALNTAVDHEIDTPAHRTFIERRFAEARRMSDAGHGFWFGAFINNRMVSGLGLFTDGSGLARYQVVDTHPDHRQQGLAGTLVYEAGCYGLEELGASQLVIVADPDYVAIRVYRSVGFKDVEHQVQLLRQPPTPPPPRLLGE